MSKQLLEDEGHAFAFRQASSLTLTEMIVSATRQNSMWKRKIPASVDGADQYVLEQAFAVGLKPPPGALIRAVHVQELQGRVQ